MSKLPFESVTLNYLGKDYEVSPDRVWGLIASIENVISRLKLAIKIQSQDIPETKIAEAYTAALTYAGVKNVMPQDVLREMSITDVIESANVLFNIMSMAVKPVTIADKEVNTEGAPTEKEPETKA